MAVGDYDDSLGPITIGANLNFFFFGLVAYQFYSYYDANYRDNWFIRLLVGWLLVMDLAHTILAGYMSWDYTIAHYDDPAYIGELDFPFYITPALVAFTSTPVQLFLAWRVFLLSSNKWLLGFTSFTAIVQGLAACGTTIGAFMLHDISQLQKLTPIVSLWFPVQVVCDVTLTASLVWTLTKSKTGYHSTDHVVKRLIRASVETAFFATAFVILDATMFWCLPLTNLHLIWALTTGRIYSNSLLGTLNARTAHREVLSGKNAYKMTPPATSASGGTTTARHEQAITISVHQMTETGRETTEDDSGDNKYQRGKFDSMERV